MDFDAFSLKKRCLPVGAARVAYYEEGTGEPVVFLHGCPFSSYIWRKVIPRLSTRYRCLAPDLLGLGDTETPARADWALPAQEAIVIEWLDALGIARAHVVGHDHGEAVAQLLAAHRPELPFLVRSIARFAPQTVAPSTPVPSAVHHDAGDQLEVRSGDVSARTGS